MRYLAFATTRLLGIFFMLLGILGLFLPFLQGILFLAIGLYFYSFSSPRLRSRIDRLIAPYPKLAFACARIDAGIIKIFRLK